jgi:hypothetical protein
MKPALILTFILLICLIVFSLADFLLLEQYENLVTRIESLPVILFSSNFSLLHNLMNELEDEPVVTSLEIERNIEILDKMIKEYDLPAAEQILDIDSLPNMLEFRLEGELITEKGYSELKERFEREGSDITLISQDIELSDLFELKQMLLLTRKAILAGIIIILSIVTFVTGAMVIRRSNYYWHIYYRSGGTKKRFRSYLLNLLLGTILSLSLLAIIFYLVDYYLQMSYEFELRYWILFGLVIFIPGLLAWCLTERS